MSPAVERPSTVRVVLAMGTVYLVWGSTYYAIAEMVRTLPPLLAAGFRYVSAGLLMFAFLIARDRWQRRRGADPGRWLRPPSGVEWRTAVIVGVLLLLGGNGGVVLGELRIPSGVAAVIIATSPIWMNTADGILVGRGPSRLATGGLLVGLVGVGILLYPSGGADALDPIGIALVFGASLSWTAGSLIARRGPLPKNQLLGSGMEMLAGGVALAVVGLLLGEAGETDPSRFSTGSLLAVLYLVVIGSLLAFSAYTWLLSHVPISTVSTYAYVNPIVAVALGTILLHEPITPRMLIAAALILGAVVAMVSGRPRLAEEQGPTPEAAAMEPSSESG
jgi:drug/metabolite transporter (DMT)-like permease